VALGLEVVMVTEGGKVNPVFPRRQQEAEAGLRFYRKAVDDQAHRFVVHDSTLMASKLLP
jgi:hypothetical protein